MDLEHSTEELDDSEHLRQAKDDRTRDLVIALQVARSRLRISELLVIRAELRKTLNLPEKVTRG